jgi:flagellar biosynthesis protein FlhF
MTKRDQMRIKSYFAKSVDQALAEARAELGAEAMLLNTRRVPATQAGGAGYEVIFGLPAGLPDGLPEELPAETPAATASPAVVLAKVSAASVDDRAPEHVASELKHLHSQMDEIRGLIARSSRARTTVGRTLPEFADIYSRLTSADVEPALSKDIVDRIEASMAVDTFFERSGTGLEAAANRWKMLRSDPRRLEAFLRVELENRVALAPRLGADAGTGGESGTVVVLVGPRGAGKTTSLAKLAVSTTRFANARPARMLSLDMSRATAHLQLQSVASTYNIAFQEVPSAYQLPKVIAEARRKETVFVDTPGYTDADANAADAAGAAFDECPGLDIHLVVPGYMKARDLRNCIQRYAPFRPSKMLVTKLDETYALGTVFSEAARAGLKLSFVASGPGIPHDIRPATSEDLMNMAIERRKARAQHVA